MTRILTQAVIASVLALVAAPAFAQVAATQYRLTRTLPGPAQSFVVLRSALTCEPLPGTDPAGPGFSFDTPADDPLQRRCHYSGTANGVIPARVPGTVYSFTLASSANGVDWTPGVPFPDVSLPGEPRNPRLRPQPPAVAMHGVVDPLFPFSGIPGLSLEVAPSMASVDGLPFRVPVYIGTPAFAGRVTPGMTWELAFYTR